MKCGRLALVWSLIFGLSGVPAIAAEKKGTAVPGNEPRLEDLGFSEKQMKVSPEDQARLERRTSMLQTHQILGLTTLGLMVATALMAKENKVPSAHKTLGIATGAAYFTTAYFSLFSPDPVKKEDPGTNVKIHKALAWIHFPLMVLTGIAGLQAEKQIERGESLHGLAKMKPQFAIGAMIAFVPAAATMVFEF